MNAKNALSPLRFYIMCGNAAHNRGDRGNLSSQIALLRHHFPHASIILDSYRPDIDRHWYDAAILKRHFFPSLEQIRHLKQADMVIWGGGALIADNSCRLLVPHWLLTLWFVRKILRKPIMAWAHGVVLETRLGAWAGKMAFNLTDVITLRDRNSYDTVQRLHLRVPIHETADPGILLQAADREKGKAILAANGIPCDDGKPIFAIAPTFWHFYHQAHRWLPYPMGKRFFDRDESIRRAVEAYKRGLVTLGTQMIQRHQARIVLIPRYPDPAWDDLAHLKDIAAQIGHPSQVHVFDDDSHAPFDYYAMYRCFDLMVSVALHDAIFATVLDVPCVHLFYEAKGRDFFQSLHAENRLLPWEQLLNEEGLERILHCIGQTRKHWPQWRQEMLPGRSALQERARENVAFLKALISTQIKA